MRETGEETGSRGERNSLASLERGTLSVVLLGEGRDIEAWTAACVAVRFRTEKGTWPAPFRVNFCGVDFVVVQPGGSEPELACLMKLVREARGVPVFLSLERRSPDLELRIAMAGICPLVGYDSPASALRAILRCIFDVNRVRAQPLATNSVAVLTPTLRVHRAQRLIEVDGHVLQLQPREFRLLEYLMRHAGQVVTRTMLLESVWDYHFDPQTNVIDVHVSRLRGKIDKGFDEPLLHTVRGAGYTLREPA